MGGCDQTVPVVGKSFFFLVGVQYIEGGIRQHAPVETRPAQEKEKSLLIESLTESRRRSPLWSHHHCGGQLWWGTVKTVTGGRFVVLRKPACPLIPLVRREP